MHDLSAPDHLDLHMTQDAEYRCSDARFSLVSEKGLVASNHVGIYLYHIPELGDVGDDVVTVSPQWSWNGYTSGSARPYPYILRSGFKEELPHTRSSSTWTNPVVFPWSQIIKLLRDGQLIA